jgi:pimeloyl-ACP methyl ester carboxylesterase
MHLSWREGDDALGTLFYIHGLGESGQCFAKLAEHPGLRRWSHLVPDLVGYGNSPPADNPPTLTQHAARLAALLAEEHPAPVVVVGHSMGGVIGTILAEEAPGTVGAFINVEGNISGEDTFLSKLIANLGEQEGPEVGLERFITSQRADDDSVIAGYLDRVAQCDPRTLFRNACELVEASEEGSLALRFASLDRPVAFIYGDSEKGLSGLSVTRLRKVGVEPRPIAQVGHWPFLEEPDAFAAVVGAFLDGLGSPHRLPVKGRAGGGEQSG